MVKSPSFIGVLLKWICLQIVVLTSAENLTPNYLQYVDQLIGSNNGGNVFAGASLPYGMAKAVADVDGQNTGGFATDGSNVTGFSHMHDSGTGSNPSLGNFPIFPQYCRDNIVDNCNFLIENRKVSYVDDSVVAQPGYFKLDLNNGIGAEMTVAQHAALYRFSFPSQDSSGTAALNPLILLDLTDLSASRQNASVSVQNNGRMLGNGTFIPSFGSGTYVSYFCADFAGASIKDSGIWVNNRAGSEPKDLFVTRGINLFYIEAGGWIQFNPPRNGTISARVGVSLISAEKACQNAENEIPGPTWDFDGLKSNAERHWSDKLNGISINAGGVDESFVTSFYSGIYRTMISPQNYTGENPLWKSTEPYFDSFYWYIYPVEAAFLLLLIL